MKEYPTDKELALFISRMEQQELYAPGHLKEEILKRAFSEQTVEALPKSGGGERTVQFFVYRLKIIAGMAAAIAMLAVLPSLGAESGYGWDRTAEKWNGQETEMIREIYDEKESMEEEANEESGRNLNYILNENMRRTTEAMNSVMGRINIFK